MKSQDMITSELLDQLLQVSVCTATQELYGAGYRNTYMARIPALTFPDEEQRIVGRAVTLRFIPLREDLVEAQYSSLSQSPHRVALESIVPGDVLVIDTGGYMDTGVIGDIFTRRVHARGGKGIIVDGVVRDLQQISTVGLPIYARGVHGGAIPNALMSVGFNEPIQCGGVAVIPGDVILADRDGAVVISPQAVATIIEKASEHEQYEQWVREKIKAGASLHTHYPPNEQVMKEFELWHRDHSLAKGQKLR